MLDETKKKSKNVKVNTLRYKYKSILKGLKIGNLMTSFKYIFSPAVNPLW